MNKSLHRLLFLDVSKALAIIAVVFSHEFASIKPLVLLCNSFMLPLFFMCSGFCMSPGKYKLKYYLIKKVRTLMVPYVLLGLLVSVLQIPVDGIDAICMKIRSDLFSWQTLWFLPVLFLADVILYAILYTSKRKMVVNFIVMIVFLILGLLLSFYKISLLLKISVVPIAIVYLSIGLFVKKIIKPRKEFIIIGFCLFIICSYAMLSTSSNLCLVFNDIMPFYKILCSVFSCVGIMMILSTFLKKNKLLCNIYSFVGKNTMIIFAFHMPVFFYCQEFIRPLFKTQLYYKPIEFVLIWGICLLLIPLFNTYKILLLSIGKSK